jgi:hypothetical protein
MGKGGTLRCEEYSGMAGLPLDKETRDEPRSQKRYDGGFEIDRKLARRSGEEV